MLARIQPSNHMPAVAIRVGAFTAVWLVFSFLLYQLPPLFRIMIKLCNYMCCQRAICLGAAEEAEEACRLFHAASVVSLHVAMYACVPGGKYGLGWFPGDACALAPCLLLPQFGCDVVASQSLLQWHWQTHLCPQPVAY